MLTSNLVVERAKTAEIEVRMTQREAGVDVDLEAPRLEATTTKLTTVKNPGLVAAPSGRAFSNDEPGNTPY
ncbi:hypothetical protein DPMN_004182 [Dreissena polymorpha]|uniref:Uncharacterized protein n=1 Tax=Dreissena polymorpha TaxID=45954 RepID=A0A9D4MS73_DREPO|nr:hypothetical protein DPMN_004182 [Dreissena polymorpha]